jgi:hypothetical protein
MKNCCFCQMFPSSALIELKSLNLNFSFVISILNGNTVCCIITFNLLLVLQIKFPTAWKELNKWKVPYNFSRYDQGRFEGQVKQDGRPNESSVHHHRFASS